MMLVAMILLAAVVLSGPSLSQTQRTAPRSRSEAIRKRQEMLSAKRMERLKRVREQAMAKSMKQSMQQAREQSLREAMQAGDAQWRIIRSKLMKVDDLQKEARVAVGIRDARWVTTTETSRGNRAGSSTPVTNTTRSYEDWSYTKSWERETEHTRAQRACDELVALLEADDATDEHRAEKMNALRQARQQAAKELAAAQQELRKVLSLRQQATLVMMGLLN